MVVSTRNRSKPSTPAKSPGSAKQTTKPIPTPRDTSRRHNAVGNSRTPKDKIGYAESESDELAADVPALVSPASTPSKRRNTKPDTPTSTQQQQSASRLTTRSIASRSSKKLTKNASPTPVSNAPPKSIKSTAATAQTNTLPQEKGDELDLDLSIEPQEFPPSKRRRLEYEDEVVAEPKDALPKPPLPREDTHPHVDLMKSLVAAKLSRPTDLPLQGLEEECSKVRDLLQQTVRAGEGNSMLLIGPRGTGKTATVNQLIQELSKDDHEHFHVIRLNGFIHTDDKLALREIWRQLGREMDIDDHGNARNYADTLATLLAVLSHPAELSNEAVPDQVAKSVIFLLEEFDLFAMHPRQTLLYNLFDIAQSRKAPIAVLGLTTRVDIAESLEKRVKSRFSHRYVYLSPPKTLSGFTEICKSALQLNMEDLSFDQRQILTASNDKPKKSKASTPKKGISTQLNTPLSAWNTAIDNLFEDAKLKHHLALLYHTTRSIPTAQTTLILPITTLTSPTPLVAAPSFDLTTLPTILPPDSKLTLLPTLPTLALALLICAARLDIILDNATTNFNMAYEEYAAQTSRSRTAPTSTALASGSAGGGATLAGRVWSRDMSRAMWERLVELELLVPVSGRVAGADSLVGAAGAAVVVVGESDMVRCDVALEEIPGAVPGLDRVLESWCREI